MILLTGDPDDNGGGDRSHERPRVTDGAVRARGNTVDAGPK